MTKKLSIATQKQEIQRLLGFSARGFRIFEIIQERNSEMSVSEVARVTRVKRTTATYILKDLARRHLIICSGTTRRPLYTKIKKGDFEEKIQNIVHTLYNKEIGYSVGYDSKKSSVRTYFGSEAIFTLWQEMVGLPKSSRIRCIQPDISFQLAIEHTQGIIPHEDLVTINKLIKQRRLIMEAVVHEESVDTITKTIKQHGDSPVAFLESFSGRTADTSSLPPGYLNEPVEMYLFNDITIIIYWPEEYAIRIQNKQIVIFFTALFSSVKRFCTRYDQNKTFSKKAAEEKVLFKNQGKHTKPR